MEEPHSKPCASPGEGAAPSGAASIGALSHTQLFGRYLVLAALDLGAKACGFGATLAIARHYGATGFGALSLAQQITVYGLLASTCGLDLLAVREAVRRPASLGSLASTVIGLRLALAAACYAVLLTLAVLLPPLRRVATLLALYGLTLFSGALTVLWVPQATQRTHVFGLAHLGIQGAYLGLVLLALERGLDLWSVPVSLLSAEVTVALALLAWMGLGVGWPRRPLTLGGALGFLGQAAPIGGAQFLRAVALGSDIVLIGLLLELSEVGRYSAAYKIYLLGISLLAVYFVVLFPQLARHGAESTDALRLQVRISLGRSMALLVPALMLGTWMAGGVLGKMFGPSYASAARALRILLPAVAVALVNGHLRHALLVLGRQRRDLGNVAVSSGVHLAAKLALIPLLGSEGAAVGTLLGEIALMTIAWRSARAALSGTS